jgi:hypothetical protein
MVPVHEPMSMVKPGAVENCAVSEATTMEGRATVTKTAAVKRSTSAAEAASTASKTAAAVKAAASTSLGAELDFDGVAVGRVFRCRNRTRTERR